MQSAVSAKGSAAEIQSIMKTQAGLTSLNEPLTSEVEFRQRVSGGRAHCRQQVNGVVTEAVAVGQVQFC